MQQLKDRTRAAGCIDDNCKASLHMCCSQLCLQMLVLQHPATILRRASEPHPKQHKCRAAAVANACAACASNDTHHAAGVLHHECHSLCCDFVCVDDEVTLILAVFVIQDNHKLA
jgi:hypothetical protein